MRNDSFEILQIPPKPIDAVSLAAAYRNVRTIWFFRQYDPEYLLEARERLEKIDEAYHNLKDPKRQALLVREVQLKRRGDAKHAPSSEVIAASQHPVPNDIPPAIDRSKIVRQLLREAEAIVLNTHRPLTTADKEMLHRKAYQMGLAFDDAEEVIPRIAQQVEP